MFKKRVSQTGGETLLGRRAILQLRDRLIKQFTLEPQVADLILGKKKKNDLKITTTKFELNERERGAIYRIEFEHISNFFFNNSNLINFETINNEDFKNIELKLKEIISEKQDTNEVASGNISEIDISSYSYCPNILNLKSLPSVIPCLLELNMDRLIPTMHLLWIHNSLFSIPSIIILKNAKQFIFNGADLMAGGIIFDLSKDINKIKKDQIWTIKCTGENFPIAIGISLVDWGDISNQDTRKGKVLKVVHHCNDILSLEGNMDFNEKVRFDPENGKKLSECQETLEVTEKFQSIVLEKKQETTLEESEDLLNESTNELEVSENEIIPTTKDSVNSIAEDGYEKQSEEISMDAYDFLLETTLLKIINEYSSDKSLLPVDSSAIWDKISRLFLRNYGIQVDIKKSSFLKVQKFFQHYSKNGILVIKQGRGGVLNVVDINNEKTKNLEKNMIEREVSLKLPSLKRKSKISPAEDKLSKVKNSQIEVVLLYQPEQNFLPIVNYYNFKEEKSLGQILPIRTSRGEKEQTFITISEARTVLEFYINSKGLKTSDPDSGIAEKLSYINLDEVLISLFHKHLDENSIYAKNKSIPISLAYKEVSSFLKVFHYIRNEADSDSEKKPNIHKGPCKTIEIYTESRMGTRKQVTIISPFISHFNLDPQEVAESCQKKFACSATVSQIKKYPSNNNLGVIIQGNVASQLSVFLNSRWGIPKSYIKQC